MLGSTTSPVAHNSHNSSATPAAQCWCVSTNPAKGRWAPILMCYTEEIKCSLKFFEQFEPIWKTHININHKLK